MSVCLARPMPRALAVATLLLLVCTSAQAHPGHGLIEHGARHAVTSPYHLVILTAIGAASWLAGRFATRSLLAKRLLRWAAATALIAAGALWSLGQ